MRYRTFISDKARRELKDLPASARTRVVRVIDKLGVGDFAGSRSLPVASSGVQLRVSRVMPRLRVVYAVDLAKELVAVVRLDKR